MLFFNIKLKLKKKVRNIFLTFIKYYFYQLYKNQIYKKK